MTYLVFIIYSFKAMMSVPWLRRLVAGPSLRRSEFAPGSINVGFVVDKVALGQVSLRVHQISPVSIIPPCLSTLVYHLQMNNRPVRGCSSET
jgi:hypothetical protein